MTAQPEKPKTMDAVVGDNIKKLREAPERAWSRAELADRLTELLAPRKPFTRYTVADLEGRRDTRIRWLELAALCSIFDVPLWELVLPPEDVKVHTKVTLAPTVASVDMSGVDVTSNEQQQIFVEYEGPGRKELAWRLFGVSSVNLDDAEMKKHWEKERKKREEEFMLDIGAAILTASRDAFRGTPESDG